MTRGRAGSAGRHPRARCQTRLQNVTKAVAGPRARRDCAPAMTRRAVPVLVGAHGRRGRRCGLDGADNIRLAMIVARWPRPVRPEATSRHGEAPGLSAPCRALSGGLRRRGRKTGYRCGSVHSADVRSGGGSDEQRSGRPIEGAVADWSTSTAGSARRASFIDRLARCARRAGPCTGFSASAARNLRSLLSVQRRLFARLGTNEAQGARYRHCLAGVSAGGCRLGLVKAKVFDTSRQRHVAGSDTWLAR